MSEKPLQRQKLYYTFGNHMHWVDMQWLWGYQVLPDSVDDMLRFCQETGTKGNINFDGIGYEKIAVESPETLQKLRKAIQEGTIEVVGASYGQPYGLFHGGESNLRQRIYGARTVKRLLGVWPKTFWEEEFDFFPQLPQMLAHAGFEYGSLFFQWTWHTPHIPYEDVPAVWWEGQDGTRLLSATRNKLNLHQWPEDFEGLLDSDVPYTMPAAGIVQWLELMPSPDWMCRSEVLLPQMHELLADERFEIVPVTMSEYLEAAKEHALVRRYTMNDVFHGMSLGKNGDKFRRLSRRAEQSALEAESISALAGLFGRPYPHWDVYPTWELEEAWRELLSAQHHDNDECEGLCGHVGKRSYERSLSLTKDITERSMKLLADRVDAKPGQKIIYNPLGWEREKTIIQATGGVSVKVPPLGYTVIDDNVSGINTQLSETDDTITLEHPGLSVVINRHTGQIDQITTPDFPNGLLKQPLLRFEMTLEQEVLSFVTANIRINIWGRPYAIISRFVDEAAIQESIHITVAIIPEIPALDIQMNSNRLPRPDAEMHASLQTLIDMNIDDLHLIHDHPFGISEVKAEGKYLRKYPSGHWMTSEQRFEEIHNPFTALQLLDMVDENGHGLLYLHDGSQAFFREGNIVRNILSMYDAWDEDYFVNRLEAKFRLIPHTDITHAQRWRYAQEFTRPVQIIPKSDKPGELPREVCPVWCDAENVAITAFYRESERHNAVLLDNNYAGAGMEFPYILRLVELNGEESTAWVSVLGRVKSAYIANGRGEIITDLDTTERDDLDATVIKRSVISVDIAPYQIVTIYLDIEMGRKIPRNLDEHRSVWATVHRVDESE